MQKITPFLMFVGKQHGKAEEAIHFYISLFRNSKVVSIERYGPAEGETPGTVKHALFTLNGQDFMAIESGRDHPFTFTPAMSLFVQCETEDEIDRLFRELSTGGKVLMELGTYPFSKKFGWTDDKYGVSWQLNLA